MIIPNIWENKSDVPNHQPDIHFMVDMNYEIWISFRVSIGNGWTDMKE